jgi:hypothetical protein
MSNDYEKYVCDCCGQRFNDFYIERWCQLCRAPSDCMPGRCGLPDNLPPDPAARCNPMPGEAPW